MSGRDRRDPETSPLAIVNEYYPSSQFVQRAFGLGAVFMLAPAQFVLVDAARRGRLGGGTFKKLNLSIAAAIAGIDWMTVYTFQAANGQGWSLVYHIHRIVPNS